MTNPRRTDDDPVRHPISFLGLRVERKTDILAATAFILALVGTGFQVFTFLRGANVSLYPPDYVILYFDTYPNGDIMVRTAAVMSYVNRGASGYSATIRRERLAFELTGRRYEQHWQSFERLDRKGMILEFHRESDALPTPILGSSAVSHSTVFAPRPVRCPATDASCDPYRNYLTKREFLKALDDTKILTLQFAAEIVGQSTPLAASCSIEINNGMIALLMMNQWYTANCWADT